MKIIRFNKSNTKKYKDDLKRLEEDAPVISDSKPYLGAVIDRALVAAIWIDEMNEICIYTQKEFRKTGIMTNLLAQLIDDVFEDKLEDVSALPINRKSARLLKKCGFFKSEENMMYLEFYIR